MMESGMGSSVSKPGKDIRGLKAGMAFKENLKTKIRIDRLAQQVRHSFKVVDGISRIDLEAARQLLALGPYRYRRERDLDLYIETGASDPDRILVLDNGLPLYRTNVADVALRKSPTVGEMLHFRNIRRILSDADVVISKKQDSVATIRQACIDRLDLRFHDADIEAIAQDGVLALESADSKGVIESLSLFCELLGYTPAPATIHPDNPLVFGRLSERDGVKAAFGPLVVYDPLENALTSFDASFDIITGEDIDAFRRAITKPAGSVSGAEAFRQLAAAVIRTGPRSYPHDAAAIAHQRRYLKNGIK